MLNLEILFKNGVRHGESLTPHTSLVDRLSWGMWHVFATHGVQCTPIQVFAIWKGNFQHVKGVSTFATVYRILSRQVINEVKAVEAMVQRFSNVRDARPKTGLIAVQHKSRLEQQLVYASKKLQHAAEQFEPLFRKVDQIAKVKPKAKVVVLLNQVVRDFRQAYTRHLELLVEAIRDCERVIQRDAGMVKSEDALRVLRYGPNKVKKPGLRALELNTGAMHSWGMINCDDHAYFSNGVMILSERPKYDIPASRLQERKFDRVEHTQGAILKTILDHAKSADDSTQLLYGVDVSDKCHRHDYVAIVANESRFVAYPKGYVDYLLWAYPDVTWRLGSANGKDKHCDLLYALVNDQVVGIVSPLGNFKLNEVFNYQYSDTELRQMAA